MLVVETIGRIRRGYFVQGRTIKAIARELKISRNTVRRVLRAGETSFAYERSVQPRPKLGEWTSELERLLEENEGRPKRERGDLIRTFEELRSHGYTGGYDAVRRYARSRQQRQGQGSSEAFVPLSFAPGEAYQFDWSHEVVLINGVTVSVKVAHVRLCHSRMPFVRAYPRESQEMVFEAHDRAFGFFRGACTRGIYDNMKTAVEAVFIGKDRTFNRRFLLHPLEADERTLHLSVQAAHNVLLLVEIDRDDDKRLELRLRAQLFDDRLLRRTDGTPRGSDIHENGPSLFLRCGEARLIEGSCFCRKTGTAIVRTMAKHIKTARSDGMVSTSQGEPKTSAHLGAAGAEPFLDSLRRAAREGYGCSVAALR
jgi:transposase